MKNLPLQKSLRGRLKGQLRRGLSGKGSDSYVLETHSSKGTISIVDVDEWLKDYEGMAVKLTIEQATID